jgi:hypothetical protein
VDALMNQRWQSGHSPFGKLIHGGKAKKTAAVNSSAGPESTPA